MFRNVSLALLLLAVAAACGDDLKRSDFNVYFYYPNDREEYLGVARGISGCQAEAHAFARSKGMSSADWDYICCRKTRSSECATKHR